MYELMRTTNWDFLNNLNDVNKALDKFYDIINNVFEQTVPKIIKSKRRYPSWYTGELIKLLKQKEKYRKVFRKWGIAAYEQEYKSLYCTTFPYGNINLENL